MAGFLDNVAGNLLVKITQLSKQSDISPIQNQLRNLEITVSILKFVLTDAEEKKAIIPELNPLLRQLHDAFSEVEDLIDELNCELLKWRVKNRKNDGEKVHCVSSCFTSNFVAYGSKINEIRERLDKIDSNLSQFNLVEKDNVYVKHLKSEMSLSTSITGSQVFARLLHLKRETILSDDYDSIIGRKKEKERIIEKLIPMQNGDYEGQFHVIAIHGIGGVGKTTLAKSVYNDDKVFDYFHKRMWVCVSEDFDVKRIRREILSCATGEQVIDVLSERQVQIRLQRNLFGRRFLLVLDDIGTFNSYRKSELKEIHKMGATGSRILVTTRSEPILNDLGSVYKIENLDEKNSMELFECASKNKNLTENLHQVGKSFLPKCDGVPLSIKCLAGLLSSETSNVEGVNVKDMNEIWKREEMKDGYILPALRLSYDLLPSYLKPCFLCFSFLPKDYVFYSYELIQIWMAQGILHSGDDNSELVGEKYFNQLLSHGLLEDVEEHALGYWFKIHNLVHELAVQLAQKEQENLGSLHLLSIVDSNKKDFRLLAISNIRSLVVPVGGVEPKVNGVPLFKCISKFQQLRFLHLCNSSLEEIPTSIDTLKHLSYVDLRGNRRIKRLPESICNMQSLQTLILAFCSGLEELPKNIKNMIGLRFLWITTKQASLRKDGIGSLTSLRFLAIGGCENLTQLFEDIDKLKSLQTLIIYDCMSLLTLPESLKKLYWLRNMAIMGCEQLKFTFTHSLLNIGLEKLVLKGFPVWAPLSVWITYSTNMNLKVLEVGDFPKLRMLPSWLSYISTLQVLRIINCPRLADMVQADDMPPFNKPPFDKLKEFRITFCGPLSKKCMDPSNHHELKISRDANIYVDSRRVKKQPDVATVEHKHDGATNDGPDGPGRVEHMQTGVKKFDEMIDYKDAVVQQPEGGTHDDLVGVKTNIVEHNGAPHDGHLKIGETGGLKHDGTTNNGYVGVGQKEEGKHVGATNDNNAGIGATGGIKHDRATNDDHAVVGPEGVKLDRSTNDDHARVGHTEGVKQDGATNDDHAGAGTAVVTLEGFS